MRHFNNITHIDNSNRNAIKKYLGNFKPGATKLKNLFVFIIVAF